MSEALSLILQYGFDTKGFDFVITQVMLDNIASQKLLGKLGFKSQEILEKEGFWKGKHHDLEQFILRRSEFKSAL